MDKINFTSSDRNVIWALFLASCITYILNIDFTSNGDTIYYANIIDTLNFDKLTTHQAYYLLGFVFTKIAYWAFGLPTDQALALMSTLFGASALCIGYLLLKRYLESERDAFIGTLMLFLCHRYFENSISAEIYIVQTFLIWSSYLLFENRRFYKAGVAIALALWVSPLTVAFGLWFPVAAYIRGFGIQSIVRLSIPILVIYLPFFYVFYEELFWGNRGLIDQDKYRQLDVISGGKNFVLYQFKHYTFLNLLILPAFFAALREKKILWLTLAASLPNIYVISQLSTEDNVFILTLDIFFVYWFVSGWRFMREQSLQWIAAVLLLAHVTVFLIIERPFLRESNKSYSREMRTAGQIVSESKNPILFTDWYARMAFVYFNRETASYPLENGYWYDLSYDLTELRELNSKPDDFDHYNSIFLMETWANSPHTELFTGKATQRERQEKFSSRNQLERFLDVKCKMVLEGINNLFRCR